MCRYPKLIRNKKYQSNIKNGGQPPLLIDSRTLYTPRGCGKCIDCLKKKAREWQVRLLEDIQHHKNGKFVALTFSNEELRKINLYIDREERQYSPKARSSGYERDNKIATKAVRWFLERWRKEYGKSLRHYFVTELGHQGTENIHLHGIIWTDEPLDKVEKIWKYGWMWKGKGEHQLNYVNERTVGYITKYINKLDKDHPNYIPKVFTTPGIGADYLKTYNAQFHKYNGDKTQEYYVTRTGHKLALPMYYRNKLFTDSQREQLWINKLNLPYRYIGKLKIDISQGNEQYNKTLLQKQKENEKLGYGTDKQNWRLKQYENERRDMLRSQRTNKNT